MPSSYTTRNRFELQNPSENNNTWGTLLNTNTFALIDQALDGAVTIACGGSSDITLTANNGSSDQARNRYLIFTGTPTSSINVIAPAQPHVYVIRSETGGSHKVRFKNSGGTQVVGFASGERKVVATDGTYPFKIAGNTTAGETTPVGAIIMWAGSVGAIPTGWAICDGNNGTQNLSEKFILACVSNGGFGTTGGNVSINTGAASTSVNTGLTVLTTANIPGHTHFLFAVTVGTNNGVIVSASTGYVSYFTNTGSDSSYTMRYAGGDDIADGGIASWAYTSAPTGHSHPVSVLDHTHVITDIRPPFYRLAFIQRIA